MKVRFYRGPHDGKVKIVQDHINHLVIPYTSKNRSNWSDLIAADGVAAPTVERVIYRRTRHTHPDGSVFFEWDQPKGTRTK